MTKRPEGRAGRTAPTIQRGRAFGVDLVAGFSFPGLGPELASGADRPTWLSLTTQQALVEDWPSGATVLVDHRRPDGRPRYRLERHPRGGYLMAAHGWGRYMIDGAGTEVRCAPARDAAWRWQRFLVGQVLPFLAVVRGHEVFHASAVGRDDRVVALTGPSGAGKSSIAFALLSRGWDFVADDVLAVDTEPGGDLVAHPGTGLLSLRPEAGTGDPIVGGRARVLGHDGEATRIAVPVDTRPRCLRTLVVLERGTGAGRIRIDRVRPVDPRTLLGAAFELVLQTPERLVRQLDVCARIGAEAEIYRLRLPPGATPDDAAALVVRALATR